MSEQAPLPVQREKSRRDELLDAFSNGKVVLVSQARIEKTREEADKGRIAVCINSEKQEIYVGDAHLNMFSSQNIPTEHYLGAIAGFDAKQGRMVVEDLWDWRDSMMGGLQEINDLELKSVLASKLQRFLYEERAS